MNDLPMSATGRAAADSMRAQEARRESGQSEVDCGDAITHKEFPGGTLNLPAGRSIDTSQHRQISLKRDLPKDVKPLRGFEDGEYGG